MRVDVESILGCDADAAWREVLTSHLLVEVAAPLVAIRPATGATLPKRWATAETVRVRSFLLGIVPIGTRVVHFERIDPVARALQTRETDPLVRRWDHLITIRSEGTGLCRYRDRIDIDAGWLTRAVWLFAHGFYRHRQRHWSKVARRLAEAQPS